MCGIFGYVGKRADAGRVVIRGIKNLEYRGYDSWGIARMIDGSIAVEKNIGKIGAVNPESFSDVCSLAIAHTRELKDRIQNLTLSCPRSTHQECKGLKLNFFDLPFAFVAGDG